VIAFGLAIIVIYLVLAAQFESFRDPLIILMAVPLSIFGAVVPLNLGFGTLNIYTQVGLITLIGLITKHGILLVEFANQQRRAHGLSRAEAIVASAKVRLRPILMTTPPCRLGVVPLIIAAGAAPPRASRWPRDLHGILVGTCFTLFVVPMFTPISRKEMKPLAEAPAAIRHGGAESQPAACARSAPGARRRSALPLPPPAPAA
jgi:multidrug efflux pump